MNSPMYFPRTTAPTPPEPAGRRPIRPRARHPAVRLDPTSGKRRTHPSPPGLPGAAAAAVAGVDHRSPPDGAGRGPAPTDAARGSHPVPERARAADRPRRQVRAPGGPGAECRTPRVPQRTRPRPAADERRGPGRGPRGPHGPGPGPGGSRPPRLPLRPGPGFGPAPAPGGPGRPGRGRSRRGDVRAAILRLLGEQPMHGYQILGSWRSAAAVAGGPAPDPSTPRSSSWPTRASSPARSRRAAASSPSPRPAGRSWRRCRRTRPRPWEQVGAEGAGDDEGLARLHDLTVQVGMAVLQVANAGDCGAGGRGQRAAGRHPPGPLPPPGGGPRRRHRVRSDRPRRLTRRGRPAGLTRTPRHGRHGRPAAPHRPAGSARPAPSPVASCAMSTLILMRHGESEWNLANLFTGWVDADLTEHGARRGEGRRAGAGRARPAARRAAHVAAHPGHPHRGARPRRARPAVDPGPALVAAQRTPLRRAHGPRQEGHGRALRRRAGPRLAPLLRRRRRRRMDAGLALERGARPALRRRCRPTSCR